MKLKFNLCSNMYILFAWILGSCYGFVLLSSAAKQTADLKLFTPGEDLTYNLHSTVLLNDKEENSKNVGFYITGDVTIKTIWGLQNQKVIKLEINEPKLHVKSRKAPAPDGFVVHTSKLDSLDNKPFFIHWNNGRVEKILLAKESPSLQNFKKGIASLFQFQLKDVPVEETDTSGTCTCDYTASMSSIIKTKTNCKSADLPYLKNKEVTLDAILKSSRNVEYNLDDNNEYFKNIEGKETHVMSISLNNEFGSQVYAEQKLSFSKRTTNNEVISGKTIKEVINKITNGEDYMESNLLTSKESDTEDVKNFATMVDELRDQLDTSLLGTALPAKAFVKLVKVARFSTKEDILKALNSKKNLNILPQIIDILGFVPTLPSYEAVMSKLNFKKETEIDLSERYLWALSYAAHPNVDVITKLLNKYVKNNNMPVKLNETLLLTITSMTYRLNVDYPKLSGQITKQVENILMEKLAETKGEESYPYIRAAKNLKSPLLIPSLLKKIQKSTFREGALAWKALKAYNIKYWNQNVKKAAINSFYQMDRKYDSSSRTIGSDVMLELGLNDNELKGFLNYLASNSTSFEVTQYAYQKLKLLASENKDLEQKITNIIKSDKKLNNYVTLSPRGFSTALKRSFVRNLSGNGSLVSLQEVKDNVAKRGIVNIIWEGNNTSSEMFSLGIFTSGLTSFLSSETQDDDDEPEITTAGLELTIFGTQLRPFVFFVGQGELMGHVWAGSASERTTAYQSLIMLQDHLEYIRLGSGFVLETSLKGAVSFDLAGKVEISIWGRTAESLVEKGAGIFVIGSMKLDTEFVKSQIEFTTSMEPKLELNSDIDFGSQMKFCLRLSQVDILFRHNIYKIERIPESKHKLRIAKYKKSNVPGMTYALNKKNNDMCNAIFQ